MLAFPADVNPASRAWLLYLSHSHWWLPVAGLVALVAPMPCLGGQADRPDHDCAAPVAGGIRYAGS